MTQSSFPGNIPPPTVRWTSVQKVWLSLGWCCCYLRGNPSTRTPNRAHSVHSLPWLTVFLQQSPRLGHQKVELRQHTDVWRSLLRPVSAHTVARTTVRTQWRTRLSARGPRQQVSEIKRDYFTGVTSFQTLITHITKMKRTEGAARQSLASWNTNYKSERESGRQKSPDVFCGTVLHWDGKSALGGKGGGRCFGAETWACPFSATQSSG